MSVFQCPAMSAPSPPVVLVTGASRGLGRGIAVALAKDGLSVAIHYASNRQAAEETLAACRAAASDSHPQFALVSGDVGRADDRRRIVEDTLSTCGRLDALVLQRLLRRHHLLLHLLHLLEHLLHVGLGRHQDVSSGSSSGRISASNSSTKRSISSSVILVTGPETDTAIHDIGSGPTGTATQRTPGSCS